MLLTTFDWIYRCLRPLLFLLPAEFAHRLSLSALTWCARLLPFDGAKRLPRLPTESMGCRFKNPVGLAAGLDKDARYVEGLLALGFGFVEVGTVTLRAQAGNAKPRLFRKIAEESLVNRMGLNNCGVTRLCRRLAKPRLRRLLRERDARLGVSIAIQHKTPRHRAVEELSELFERVRTHADYVVINFSSPNAPGLRDYQNGADFESILGALYRKRQQLPGPGRVPLLVKLSPDQSEQQLLSLVPALKRYSNGVIFANTMAYREGAAALPGSKKHPEISGGLSGRLLQPELTGKTGLLAKALQPLPLVACGGIDSAAVAADRLHSGARLLQLYTALVYKGPALVRDIVHRLAVCQ